MKRAGMYLLVVATVFTFAQVEAALLYSDSFNYGINSSVWDYTISNNSDPNSITWNGSQVVVTQSGSYGGAGLIYKPPISGDFEAVISYQVLNWRSNKYYQHTGMGISGTTAATVEHVQVGNGPFYPFSNELQYASNFGENGGGNITRIPTTDMGGSLLLKRSGNYFSSFYYDWSAGKWQLINYYSSTAYDPTVNLGFASWNDTAWGKDIKIGFDNFRLYSVPATTTHLELYFTGPPNPVPIPAAAWLLGTGLIGLVGLRRKLKR